MKNELHVTENFDCGLDVGCGAGASTIALKAICDRVIGLEASAEMCSVAKAKHKSAGIRFFNGKAEDTAFADDSFDIVTACGSVNWIDPKRFLPLLRRQIKSNGWFIIYDDSIASRIVDSQRFTAWYSEEYLLRYPKPPRNEEKWDDDLLRPYGFSMVRQEAFSHTVTMNEQQFVNFMVTQSNVIAAVEQGDQALESVIRWFHESLASIFGGGSQDVNFEGYVWYIVKR